MSWWAATKTQGSQTQKYFLKGVTPFSCPCLLATPWGGSQENDRGIGGFGEVCRLRRRTGEVPAVWARSLPRSFPGPAPPRPLGKCG